MSDIFSALWFADNVGSFFAEDGTLYIHSPIEPSVIEHGCQGWAIWRNALWDRDARIIGYTAFYRAGKMINAEWVTHRTGTHHLYAVDVGIEDRAGNALVTSYAVRRPDGHGALLLINKDKDNAHSVRVAFESGVGTGHFSGKIRTVTFGSEQYVWHGADASAHAEPNLPPVVSSIDTSAQTVFTLRKASVTVLQGELLVSRLRAIHRDEEPRVDRPVVPCLQAGIVARPLLFITALPPRIKACAIRAI
jgi:hypothetical protein